MKRTNDTIGVKKMKHVKSSLIVLAAVFTASMISSVQAGVVADCTSTGYSYMSGSVASPDKDYMLTGEMAADSWWGFSWLSFETPDSTVEIAYLNLQSIAQGGGMWAVPDSSPVTMTVYAVTADVASITSSNVSDFRDNHIGGAVASISVSGGDAIYSWDITDLVNGWITGDNYGLVLSVDGDGSTVYGKFSGLGHSTGMAPVITDTALAVPEPATMMLLGLGSLIRLRKRK